ncbi:hydroxyethylthiazole kinase [Methanobrevibacter sp.]|uniref:hydroxyethylthiazole kinase n=1 Tax=Methanobrevibacter sp. TaxID=66852 RepID=UPI0025CE023E|nr:hydroxyethylthiazole kinase [Methanobrevibacter sp.]MBQ2961691.1 hydroxyethylthiazole kinase [Methanobrevibacter sp.]
MTDEIIIKDNENVKNILNGFPDALNNVKEISPLTFCITNFVTVTDCANAALAIGASPIMSNGAEEGGEIVNIANALVINIGTLSKSQNELMRNSADKAKEIGKPIIFDPVGAGVSSLRNDMTKEIVENYPLALVRGNMSEIKAIAKLIALDENNDSAGKGVDVAESDIISKDTLESNASIVKSLAKELDAVVIASGPIDIISDGDLTFGLENGDEMMPLITGSGCMLTTIIGSYVGANDPLIGGITACALMAVAGENAAEYVRANDLGTGSFRTLLMDNLYKLDAEDLVERANLFEISV